MVNRWKTKEAEALKEMRNRVKDVIATRTQFPEVVGDRRLLRFLRGKSYRMDDSVKAYKDFLKWRDDNNIDKIRQDIVYGGKDSAFKFPFGELALAVAPQIILTANAQDKKGRLLAMETFDFSPKELFESVKLEDYLTFLTYTLEYRALMLEQVSHEREQKYLAEHPNPDDRTEGYGVVAMDYTIRDLKGVSMAHLGSKGRELVSAALKLSLPNYPEYLDRCVLINTPWVFNTFWYFVKALIDEVTLTKICLCGADYMPMLLEDLTIENIPAQLGGKFTLYNESFAFDRSVGGPLYCEGCPTDTEEAVGSISGSYRGSSNSYSSGGNDSSVAAHNHMGRPESDKPAELIKHVFERPVPAEIPTFLQSFTLYSLLYIVCSFISRKPFKTLLVTLFVGLFWYLRESGLLQYLVYPVVVYVYVFSTKSVVSNVCTFFGIDARS